MLHFSAIFCAISAVFCCVFILLLKLMMLWMQWQINIQVPKLIIFKIRVSIFTISNSLHSLHYFPLAYMQSFYYFCRNKCLYFSSCNKYFRRMCDYVYKHRDSYNFMLRCYVTLSRVESPIATDRSHATLHRGHHLCGYIGHWEDYQLNVIILQVYIWKSCSSYRLLMHYSTYTVSLNNRAFF